VLRSDLDQRADSTVSATGAGRRILQYVPPAVSGQSTGAPRHRPQYQRWVEAHAKTWGTPIVEAPVGWRDKFVDPYFRRPKPDQVVVIVKGREPARILTAIGKDDRWHLQHAQRWIVQYNFYVNDAEWGRMFVRLCPYFPFSARVCLNQHHWLATRMRAEEIRFRQESNAFLTCLTLPLSAQRRPGGCVIETRGHLQTQFLLSATQRPNRQTLPRKPTIRYTTVCQESHPQLLSNVLQLLFRVRRPRLDPVRLHEIGEQFVLVHVLFFDEAESICIEERLGEKAVETETNTTILHAVSLATPGWRISLLHPDHRQRLARPHCETRRR